MKHEFQSIVCQDVELMLPHPSTGLPPTPYPLGTPVEVIGCKNCHMGLEEALTLSCPGLSLEAMMEL